MPQITLEYTENIKQNVDSKYLLREIHKILHKTTGVAIQNCKSRVMIQKDFYVGDEDGNGAFVHMDIAIMEGRTDEVKNKAGNEILSFLGSYFKETFESNNLQITVEIKDIIKKNYFKKPALK